MSRWSKYGQNVSLIKFTRGLQGFRVLSRINPDNATIRQNSTGTHLFSLCSNISFDMMFCELTGKINPRCFLTSLNRHSAFISRTPGKKLKYRSSSNSLKWSKASSNCPRSISSLPHATILISIWFATCSSYQHNQDNFNFLVSKSVRRVFNRQVNITVMYFLSDICSSSQR